MPNTKSWQEVRRQKPLNERRVEAYKRLMDAETRLAEPRARRGLSQAAIADALDVSQPNVSRIEQEEDLYLSRSPATRRRARRLPRGAGRVPGRDRCAAPRAWPRDPGIGEGLRRARARPTWHRSGCHPLLPLRC